MMDLTVFKKNKVKFKLTPVDAPYVCQFCNKKFVKEKTLTVHVCEKKRRHLSKHEKHVQIGYDVYNKFFQLNQNTKGNKTYDEFAESQYYNAFVKFGSFINNVNPLYPDNYTSWIVRSGIKLDHWCREEHYYLYLEDLVFKESAETALERAIKTMVTWSEENNSQWNHYFKYVSPTRAAYDIKEGKITGWLIFNCNTGKNMLARLNDEQLSMVENILDPKKWIKKFSVQPADIILIKDIVNTSNL